MRAVRSVLPLSHLHIFMRAPAKSGTVGTITGFGHVAMFSIRRMAVLTGLALLAGSLGGCGSISSFVAGSMGDYIPVWAGGLPANAPPRPGTAKYDEWIKQREQPVAAPAAKSDAERISSSSAAAVH